jgi:hypothetical protein
MCMKNRFLLIGLVMNFGLGIEWTSAQIHHVPDDYSTIQAAINAAERGDTVLVGQGTYYENINFRGKGITVASSYLVTNDPEDILATIIDGSMPSSPDTGSCVLLVSGEDSTAVLEGFTLTHGTGLTYKYIGTDCNCNFSYSATWREGGAVAMAQSAAIIKHNFIIDNTTFGGTSNAGGGGGIASMYGNPNIINNVLVNNTGGYGCGITINISSGLIKNNIVYHNHGGGDDNGGGVMFWHAENATIENNTIIGNYTINGGGGIASSSSTDIMIRNNIVWGNRQQSGNQINGTYTYCDVEDMVEGEGNIKSFPMFVPDIFTLAPGSFCIDAGVEADNYNDLEDPLSIGNALYPSSGTLRNDMGAFGGPFANIMNSVQLEDLYIPTIAIGTTDIGTEKLKKTELLNRGTSEVTIDSIKFTGDLFYLSEGLIDNILSPIEIDSITVGWTPTMTGDAVDTLLVYHSFTGIENPKKVIVSGKALDVTLPTAVAGEDTTTTLDLGTITINGSGSFDDNALPLKYFWALVGKPAGSAAEMLYVTNRKGILKYDITGEYFVTLEVDNSVYSSVADTIKITVVEHLSVEKPGLIGEVGFNLYPNPVTDKLTISIVSCETGKAKLVLTDIYGKVISTSLLQIGTGTLNLNLEIKNLNIAPGVYFINYIGTKERFTRKFIYLSNDMM